MNTILKVDRLTKKYGDQYALKDFDLSVRRGEIIGIAGSNGAGKTTLFRLISGLIQPTAGHIELFGSKNAKELRENRRLMSVTIEEPAFLPDFTAEQNLEYFRVQRGIADKSRIKDVLKIVGLDQTGKKKFKDFSLGMRQRLSIALAFLHQPDLMIFDEPTNGLDPQGIIHMRHILQQLAHERQIAVLVSSHILAELENLADRFVLVGHGIKKDEFTKEEMHEKLQNFIEIIVNEPQKAAVLLEDIFHTKNYEVDDQGIIKLFDTEIDSSAITRALVENNVAVSQIIQREVKLEDLYLDTLTEDLGGSYHD